MGLNPSSDHFCLRSDEAFALVEDLLEIIDDRLLQAPSLPDLLKGFRCSRFNLMLSRPKLQIGQSVIFAGYEISKDGVKPETRKTDAISKFTVPKNVSDLCCVLGPVSYTHLTLPTNREV